MCEFLKILNCIQSLRILNRCEVCSYCGEPFKECDTFYSDGRFEIGEIDVIGFKESFYHIGCLLDYLKDNDIYPDLVNELVKKLESDYFERNAIPNIPYEELFKG